MLSAAGAQAKLGLSRHPAHHLLGSRVVSRGLGPAQVRSNLVGRDELLVFVNNWTAKRSLLDDNGREDKPGANLDEVNLEVAQRLALGLATLLRRLVVLVEHGAFGFANLIVANPDLAVGDGESHDVIDERLGLSGALGNAKRMREHLLDNLEVGLCVERGIERKDWARALEAVASEVQLLHRVHWRLHVSKSFCGSSFKSKVKHTILQVEFYSRAIRHLAKPHVEILSFARLEKENVVAVVQLGQLVELGQTRFRIELGILSAVRKHRGDIVQ